jgi:ribosomal protein S27E
MAMSDGSGTCRSGVEQRGIYIMADTPLAAHPLALEDGGGDKKLLAESLAETLSEDEVDDLINELIRRRVSDESDGTNIECEDCGHVRETTEENPTLVTCDSCGSWNLRYVEPGTSHDGDAR